MAHNDEEVSKNVQKAISSTDAEFIWCRLRGIERFINYHSTEHDPTLSPANPSVKVEISASNQDEIVLTEDSEFVNVTMASSTLKETLTLTAVGHSESLHTSSSFDSLSSIDEPEKKEKNSVPHLEPSSIPLNRDAKGIESVLDQTAKYITEIYNSLPIGSAFVVFSPHGNVAQLNQMQNARLSARSVGSWTDEDQLNLQRLVSLTKEGCAFLTIRE